MQKMLFQSTLVIDVQKWRNRLDCFNPISRWRGLLFPKKLAFHSDYGEPRRGGHKTPPTARDAFERARLVGLTQFTTNKLNSQTTN